MISAVSPFPPPAYNTAVDRQLQALSTEDDKEGKVPPEYSELEEYCNTTDPRSTTL